MKLTGPPTWWVRCGSLFNVSVSFQALAGIRIKTRTVARARPPAPKVMDATPSTRWQPPCTGCFREPHHPTFGNSDQATALSPANHSAGIATANQAVRRPPARTSLKAQENQLIGAANHDGKQFVWPVQDRA